MQIDKLNEPDCLCYEDKNGKVIKDVDISSPPWFKNPNIEYQISKFLVVKESIHRVGDPIEARWPVRFLHWVITKMPEKWQAQKAGLIFSGEASINFMFPVLKYLVDIKGWGLNAAAILCSECCGRCSNVLLGELNVAVNMSSAYIEKAGGTYCKHCKVIDPVYDKKHRVWCCYRTLKLGGDIKKAYENTSCYSNKDI